MGHMLTQHHIQSLGATARPGLRKDLRSWKGGRKEKSKGLFLGQDRITMRFPKPVLAHSAQPRAFPGLGEDGFQSDCLTSSSRRPQASWVPPATVAHTQEQQLTPTLGDLTGKPGGPRAHLLTDFGAAETLETPLHPHPPSEYPPGSFHFKDECLGQWGTGGSVGAWKEGLTQGRRPRAGLQLLLMTVMQLLTE